MCMGNDMKAYGLFHQELLGNGLIKIGISELYPVNSRGEVADFEGNFSGEGGLLMIYHPTVHSHHPD